MTRFEGKRAIVLGAANGIGRATAARMAAEGATVAAVDINEGRLNELVVESKSSAGSIKAFMASAVEQEEVDRAVAEFLGEGDGIDILVNTVGGSTILNREVGGLETLLLEEWRALVDFNLTGCFLSMRSVIPVMKAQNSGKIVNVASIAGRGLSKVSNSAYAAAKGGLIALTRKLSFELGPHGITCNAIAPGISLTDRVEPRWNNRSAEEKAGVLANIPLGRLPRSEDQAGVICFLSSEDANFVTGVTIDVAGGQR